MFCTTASRGKMFSQRFSRVISRRCCNVAESRVSRAEHSKKLSQSRWVYSRTHSNARDATRKSPCTAPNSFRSMGGSASRKSTSPTDQRPTQRTSNMETAQRTELERHVEFWDRDGDGVIWPNDTFVGLRKIGFGPVVATALTGFLHTGLYWGVKDTFLPNPLLPLPVKNMKKGEHGSATRVYDRDGKFDEELFDRVMQQFDSDGKGGLTRDELLSMSQAQWEGWQDWFGWAAGKGEWLALWTVAHDENGVVSRDAIRAQYDGTLWDYLDKKYEGGKKTRTW